MYREAVDRLLEEAAGLRSSFELESSRSTSPKPIRSRATERATKTIIGTKEQTDEYAYQWATVQLSQNAVPPCWDARPVRKGESRKEIVEDPLNSAEDPVHVDNVLMDREFDSQHCSGDAQPAGFPTSFRNGCRPARKLRPSGCSGRDRDRYETDRKLHLGKNERHQTTLNPYHRKENAEHDDHRQYSVSCDELREWSPRSTAIAGEIESGYRSIKRFMAATTSKDFGFRFYFAFACLPTRSGGLSILFRPSRVDR